MSAMRYVRVMDGITSNAGKFQYQLDAVNVAINWNPNETTPEKMGGFSFSTEDKILRWLHRGDTIYDVEIPKDAEVVLVNQEKGIYRTNKIIVTNPRKLTHKRILKIYQNTNLSNRILAQCLLVLVWKEEDEIAKYIAKEKVTKYNACEFIDEFEKFAGEKNLKNKNVQEIYEMLKEKYPRILIRKKVGV